MPTFSMVIASEFEELKKQQASFVERAQNAPPPPFPYEEDAPAGTRPIRCDFKDFRGCDFSGMVLWGAQFHSCRFNNIKFLGADLDDAKFTKCEFINADLTGIWGEYLQCKECVMKNSIWDDAVVLQADFYKSQFNDASMDRFCALETDFSECDFTNVNMRYSYMRDCNLALADLTNMHTAQSWFSSCGRKYSEAERMIVCDPNEEKYPSVDKQTRDKMIEQEYYDTISLIPDSKISGPKKVMELTERRRMLNNWRAACILWKEKRDEVDLEIQDNMLEYRLPVLKSMLSNIRDYVQKLMLEQQAILDSSQSGQEGGGFDA